MAGLGASASSRLAGGMAAVDVGAPLLVACSETRVDASVDPSEIEKMVGAQARLLVHLAEGTAAR